MLRTSSYTIYADLPGERERVLLVHGYTGAYDRVSSSVASYLRSLEAGPPPAPLYGAWSPPPKPKEAPEPPSDATLQQLEQRGYLTRRTVEEEREFFSRVANRHHQDTLKGRLVYIVMPTYDCNLRCPYCFQDHMRTDSGYSHLLVAMNEKTADNMVQSWLRIEERHGVTKPEPREVTFFGGEPLLKRLRPAVERVMNKARELGQVNFKAVSNATELDAYQDLLGPGGIHWIQVTLDGTPQEHDKRRIYEDGSGSFQRISDNIDMALEQGASIAVRLNIDRDNIKQLPELTDYFVQRGWDARPGFSCYSAPIHPTNGKTDHSRTLTSWGLAKALTRMRGEHPNMRLIARPDDGIQQKVAKVLHERSDPFAMFKSAYCGAHAGMYVFDPKGDVYACWEKTGDANIRIASIKEGGQVEWCEAADRMWKGRTVDSNPICRQCRYALYCGGGCAVLAMGNRGEYFTNYCDGFAARFRQAVAEAYLGLADRKQAPPSQLESVCGV
ncbi:MAG TPA: radical SAM protein [Acidobacteriota bacterium]|nr:radical SAM protein [Acidobacteriota bacterium]